jgi:hypothetical protein
VSADLTTVIVAALGLVGTLTSPALTQRAALKARREEVEAQRAERAEARLSEEMELRRRTYVDLNARARHYRSAALDHLSALAASRGHPDDTRLELDAARRAFAECHSQAQMIVPDGILRLATETSRKLGDAYRLLTRDPSDVDLHGAKAYVEATLGEALWIFRAAMRADLGILEDEPNPDS